jgi:shikimate kinase
MNQNVFLIGLMGAGKTSIGKLLAHSLSYQFIDSDQEIIKRTGVSIATIFDIEGEAGFRQREKNILEGLVSKKNMVLATGGGIILLNKNRELLKKNGYVIYLKPSLEQLIERLRYDKLRPILRECNPDEKIRLLYDHREPLYTNTAHYIIEPQFGESLQKIHQKLLIHLKGVLVERRQTS